MEGSVKREDKDTHSLLGNPAEPAPDSIGSKLVACRRNPHRG